MSELSTGTPAAPSGLRIGVDLDGCCYDFVNGIRTWRWLKHGVPLDEMPEADNWSFYKTQWGMTTPEFLTACKEAVLSGHLFWQGPVFPDAVDVIRRLSERHQIVVVTDRGFSGAEQECQDATRHWLATKNIPYDELHFTADKTQVGLDAMVDDKVENVEALLDAGVDTYLMVRRHNYRSHIPADRRVNNWWEFEEILNRKALERKAA